MDLYRKVRLACRDGMSERAAARHFGVSRQSVRKMLQFSVPPGYRRTAPVRRPKLDEFTALIEQWLEDDRRHGYRKQRHTAKRIFERLRDEHGFTGGYTIVKDYVREHRRHRREMFVPLTHPPGHAQADFGEAWAVIAGVKQKVHFFAFDCHWTPPTPSTACLGTGPLVCVKMNCRILIGPLCSSVARHCPTPRRSVGSVRSGAARHLGRGACLRAIVRRSSVRRAT